MQEEALNYPDYLKIEAVKIYGAVYGRRISPDLLEVEQGIPAGHAAAISAAVRRILPKVGGG